MYRLPHRSLDRGYPGEVKTKGLAESFLSSLRQAAKNGEAFDLESGLPSSMVKAKDARTWYAFAVAYVHAWWPHAAAKSREGMTDALANVTPVLMRDLPGRPDENVMRRALREFSFLPEDRRPVSSPEIVRTANAMWPISGSWMPSPRETSQEHKHTKGLGSRRDPSSCMESITVRRCGGTTIR